MMGSEESEKKMVITQVSVGGFDNYVTAKMLLDYFEDKIGLVWRCRLKTSSTPPNSYPEFKINPANVQGVANYKKVEPHAFVHFVHPDSAKSTLNAAGLGELVLITNVLKVNLGPESPYRMNQWRRNKSPFKLSDVLVEIGLLVSQNEFFVGWKGPSSGVDFLVDPFDGTCKFLFTKDIAFSLQGTAKYAVIKCNFKVEFLVRDIDEIKDYRDSSYLIMMLQLASSPLIYYRTADDDVVESVPFDLLDDDDPWIRTTDFTPSRSIGRCNTYRISIRPREGTKLENALNYLKEQLIPINLPKQQLTVQDEPDIGMPMSNPFSCISYEGLPFKILFLLNAVLHKGIMNQHQLSDGFFNLLKNQSVEVSVAALKHIYTYRRPLDDAYMRMKLVQEWLVKNPKLIERPSEPIDIVEVRRLVITPSKAYCLPPEVELSNRVLRHYREVADRFLRVTFMDEDMQMLNKHVLTYYPALIVKDITLNSKPQKTTIFKRVMNILNEGFKLCGRKYSFLSFSTNQLRDHSAWFFAEDQHVCCNDIISWMGEFSDKNVAKCAARMGLCFSSTYATLEVPKSEVNFKLRDIKRNGYDFSDGIGKISPDLAMKVAEKLQLQENPPCAYQLRYTGCKGVAACWPTEDDKKLSIRPSMIKFKSNHTVLEICSWTRPQPGFLNRQIITLLSTLEVSDAVFWKMQENMVAKLNQMIVDPDVAFNVVIDSCSEQGNSAAIMLSAGFTPQTEPHLQGMLSSIRAAQFGDLREKARIFVPSGRRLMGCLDEIGVLEQGQCFIQVSRPSLQSCFAKHDSRFSEPKKNLEVIKGLVVIAKNPCLHPGDVRILEAVDAPGLNHLYDCLIFPQKGDRPHTNEASGSDLDGDLYFVTWDENLIPPSKRSWPPMEYDAPEVKVLHREVMRTDIIKFFTNNMVNENLGPICNAHVVHADQSDDGALDEKCIRLAKLAATAVDFPKTAKVERMPSDLRPKLYPDFMEKEDFESYKSNKILGKLYRKIIDAYDMDDVAAISPTFVHGDVPYDTDLEILGSEGFIMDAWNCKCSYDSQVNSLLGQFKVNREEEIVTGHIWSMPIYSSKKQGELKERLKLSYSALRKEYRKAFESLCSEFDQLPDEEKNSIYEKKASAWYQVTYHPSWVKRSLEIMQEPNGVVETVMLSFAWIAVDYIARIKIRRRGIMSAESMKPVNSLARYLADRI